MTYQIKVKSTALLKQRNALLETENENLRLMVANSAAIAESEEVEAEELDYCALVKKRDYLEDRSTRELNSVSLLDRDKIKQCARDEGKTALLCHLKALQLWKFKLAEAELATTVSQMWACKTDDFEESINCIMNNINAEIAKCPDDMNPYLVDAINETMKDC